jgi:AcrR family transcriptional regulator
MNQKELMQSSRVNQSSATVLGAKALAAPGRAGRPPVSRTAEVDTRILEAATRLFLGRGFEGTSCDQVALDARAGKASIYARYSNKEALFAAVIDNYLQRAPVLELPRRAFAALTLRDTLKAVGKSVVDEALQADAVALLRLLISEAPRFPELTQQAERMGWHAAVDRIANAIADPDQASPAGVDWVRPMAAKFVELVLVPQQMRALLGADLQALRAITTMQIEEAVTVMAATGWSQLK